MKRLIPWIGGLMIGLILAALAGGILLVRSIFADQPDLTYELVSVSWGTPSNSPDLWIYQVQVIAADQDKDGTLEISARGCIGSSSYFRDFGSIGSASDMGEAVRNYGDITWTETDVSIGGADGTMASVSRSQLEKHR